MAVVKCENGHYYDNSVYGECPHCQNQSWNEGNIRESVTVAMQEEIQQYAAAYVQGQGPASSAPVEFDEEKTIAIYSKLKGNDFVAGWVVCTKGPERGRSFELYHGFNRIGRGEQNDVCLAGDKKITREEHFSIVYENRKNRFFAVPQGGYITYLNGETLRQAEEIATGDVLAAGESTLEFVAFCRGDKKW